MSSGNNIEDTSLDTVDGIWRARARALIKAYRKEKDPSTSVVLEKVSNNDVSDMSEQKRESVDVVVDDDDKSEDIAARNEMASLVLEEEGGNKGSALDDWNSFVSTYLSVGGGLDDAAYSK